MNGGGHHHGGGGGGHFWGSGWGGGWGPGWWGPDVVVAQSEPACPVGQMAIWNDAIGQYNCAPVPPLLPSEGMSGLSAVEPMDFKEVGGGALIGAVVGAAVGRSGHRMSSALTGAAIGAVYIAAMKFMGK
jgi:hypothetical protein